jgi:hypothetical protein
MDWRSLVPYLLGIWAVAALLQLIRLLRTQEGVPAAALLRDGAASATAVSLVLIADEAWRAGLIPGWAFAVVLLAALAGLVVLLRPARV